MMHLPRSRAWRGWPERLLGALAVTLAVAGCTPLPDIGPGSTCGNRVKDTGEACDTFPKDEKEWPRCGASCWYICDPDEPAADEHCPDGNHCGFDGICRAPSGQFAESGQLAAAGADELSMGDLDGDQVMDVIATTDREVAIRFGRPSVEPIVVRRQAFEPLFLPVALDREDGAGADLLVPRYGLVSLSTTGTSTERQLEPAGLPALVIPDVLQDVRIIPSDHTSGAASPGLMFHATIEGLPTGTVYAVAFFDSETLATLGPARHGAIAMAPGSPVVAPLDESPCDDIVIAYEGDDRVEFFNPCRLVDGEWTHNQCDYPFFDCPDDLPRLLDVGASVVRGPFVAQLNPQVDDSLDLLVQVEGTDTETCDPCYEVRVAFGVGNGTFHSDGETMPLPGEDGDDSFAVLADFFAQNHQDQLLLALGDLDGDAQVDVVTPRFILLDSQSDAVAINTGEPWTEALIADFHADGWADVLAVDAVSAHASYLNNVGKGLFTQYWIPTEAPLEKLGRGDFDGDGLGDAVAMAHFAKEDHYQVSVLFGQPAGAPSPPVGIGKSDLPLEIQTGMVGSDILLSSGGVNDGATDVMAIGVDDGGPSRVHLFLGRGDREIRSPLGLVEMTSDNLFSLELGGAFALRVVAGRFRSEQQATGDLEPRHPWRLAVLGIDAFEFEHDYRLWLLPELGDGARLAAMGPAADPIQRQASTTAIATWELGIYGAVDLDGDGLDELVAFAPLADDPNRSAYRVGQSDGAGGWRWVPDDDVGTLDIPLFRSGGPTVPCRDPYGFPDVPQTGEDRCAEMVFSDVISSALDLPRANGRLRACNLVGVDDDSKRDDLVVLSRPPFVEESHDNPWPGQAELLVVVNDGSLSLSEDRFSRVVELEGVEVRDFACLQADGDAAQEIVVLTSEGLWLVDYHGQDEDNPFKGDDLKLPLDDLYRRIAAGAIDGDGLDDLVLANPNETIALHARCQAPCLELAR